MLTRSYGALYTTNESGAFQILLDDNFHMTPSRVDFLHALGFAIVPKEELNENVPVRLQPWGMISGTLKIGDTVGNKQTVGLYSGPFVDSSGIVRYRHHAQATTEENGRFAFPRVFPGKGYVARQMDGGNRGIGSSHAAAFTIQSGESLKINLGGQGRSVVGKVELPKEQEKYIDWKGTTIEMIPIRETGPGAIHDEATPDWDVRRGFPLENGRFQIDDVPAGMWELSVVLYSCHPLGSHDVKSWVPFQISLTKKMPITVPAKPGGPLNIGVLSLELPDSTVEEFAKEYDSNVALVWEAFGIHVRPLDRDEFPEKYRNDYPDGGVRIIHIRNGSPLQEAGAQNHDILVGFNGFMTSSEKDLTLIAKEWKNRSGKSKPTDFLVLRGDVHFRGTID